MSSEGNPMKRESCTTLPPPSVIIDLWWHAELHGQRMVHECRGSISHMTISMIENWFSGLRSMMHGSGLIMDWSYSQMALKVEPPMVLRWHVIGRFNERTHVVRSSLSFCKINSNPLSLWFITRTRLSCRWYLGPCRRLDFLFLYFAGASFTYLVPDRSRVSRSLFLPEKQTLSICLKLLSHHHAIQRHYLVSSIIISRELETLSLDNVL